MRSVSLWTASETGHTSAHTRDLVERTAITAHTQAEEQLEGLQPTRSDGPRLNRELLHCWVLGERNWINLDRLRSLSRRLMLAVVSLSSRGNRFVLECVQVGELFLNRSFNSGGGGDWRRRTAVSLDLDRRPKVVESRRQIGQFVGEVHTAGYDRLRLS